MNKSIKIQMTTGSLWKNIFLFSVPLMFSQLLEVMFNISDVAIVGKFADYRALGSVGSTTLLVSLFIGFLIGMGSGVNVRVAHMLGSDNRKAAEETIHTSFIICLSIGLIICAVCVFGAEWMLSLLHTKSELIDGAILYLRIYAIGLPAMAVYNWGNGILSARGETTRPLVYLAISGTLNVILNLFFVIKCHRAADGVAMASAISQYVSAGLILTHLLRRKDECRFMPSHIRLHKDAAGRVLALGLPAGLQNAIFAIANLFVQAGVNSFDEIMVSGNSAACNADTIIFNVLAAFYTACATFTGQNLGARNRKRVLHSYFICLFYSTAAALVLGILLKIFGRGFLSLFTSKEAVIDAGMERIGIMWFSFIVAPFMDCTISASRGIGKSLVPTIVVIMGSCVFRVIWVYTIFAYFHTIPSLYLLYIFSWFITATAEIIYFIHSYRKITF